ncbi:ketopantoate reductase C-terminal domain-containing protein [Rhizobium giardinii]|uniref:2-dehydropantoate 2-reductase n=1 Tax=Rhizobium giardinii TaxID=56731 RepID=A0A7W8U961_9HYPH|nr:ketopantoate reductase C-terminal domain-containing protein [Rhizobium giardinii]MBB5535033.1 2-dehydropantoate 2-reductase [Rhizobium giardinii]
MPPDFSEETAGLFVALPPETRASMVHDLAQGRRMEPEWLSGRIPALGLKHGISTPAHTAVYRALHLHSRGDVQ